jgi:hypothetical protein
LISGAQGNAAANGIPPFAITVGIDPIGEALSFQHCGRRARCLSG